MGAVEKKGLFEKIKEKYKAHEEAVEQKREEELADAVHRQIGGLGATMSGCLNDISNTPVEYKSLPVGTTLGAAARFTTNDDMPIVSYIVIQYIDRRPSGGSLYVFPTDFIFGSFVVRSIPLSMIAKRISSQRVFIPFQTSPDLQFNAYAIWMYRINWNPLVDALNNDKQLLSDLSSLPDQATIYIPKSMGGVTSKIEDGNERNFECLCQIVPYENLTFFGIRALIISDTFASSMKRDKRVKSIISALRLIRGHILDYGHGTLVTGQIAQDWIKIPIFLFQSGFYKPANI